jgi:hypothetical protein
MGIRQYPFFVYIFYPLPPLHPVIHIDQVLRAQQKLHNDIFVHHLLKRLGIDYPV